MNISSKAITIAKALLDINDTFQDDLFVILGTAAENDALLFTNNEQVLFQYDLLGRMIQHSYLQRGNESLASQSIASVSETYITGNSIYPLPILTALKGFSKLKSL